jgi:hypothetical protein
MESNLYYIEQIQKNPNKNHYQSLRYQLSVRKHISGLRLLAKEKRGTTIAKFCNKEANNYERLLNQALEQHE